MMRIISSRLVSSANVASYVSLARYQLPACKMKILTVLDHILCDTIDLLLLLHIRQCVEVQATIAFQKTRTNALQLLAIFGRRRMVFVPNKMKHLLDANLHNAS